MNFSVSYSTNVGTTKANNEDSLSYDEAETDEGKILQVTMCDGMGGLDRGELASATVVKAFSDWFYEKLPGILAESDVTGGIKMSWNRLIKTLNNDICEYGNRQCCQLGSTLTVVIFLEDGTFVCAHVGDTRLYRITDSSIDVITDDQTVVGYKIRNGTLTPEKAKTHPQRNVLLQCVGATMNVNPEFYEGKAAEGENYMLCSDGFRNELEQKEIFESMKPSAFDGSRGPEIIGGLIDKAMSRGEKDNITSIVVEIK